MTKMIKKIAAFSLAAFMIVGVVTPASAGTVEDLQAQIAALQAQLNGLLAQLAGLQGTPSGTCVCTFTQNLYPGVRGAQVKCLQQYLNGAGYTLASSGPGSSGNETEYFGSLTQAAVKKWQDANGVSYGAWAGYFGPVSRAKYNALCVVQPPVLTCPDYTVQENCEDASCYWYSSACHTESEAEATCADYTVESDCTDNSCYWWSSACHAETEPAAGTLTITLAADTPASASIATGANANFTKVVFTAGGADVSISKVYVTRSGNSANSDLENLKFVDMDGVVHGSIGSLNVNSKAMITFTPALKIEAGKSVAYHVRAGVASTATAGRTASLGIALASDVTATGSEVTVSGLPVTGNLMSVVSLTIGTATISEDGTTVDSQPDVGDTDVTVNQFKIVAGSTEAITVEQITAMEAGTASLDDIENIELYSVTDNKSLGSVSGWNSEGKASWGNLGIVIAKGNTHRFKIMVDVIDGTSLTVNADVKDGSDWLVTVKGNTYGYYITPAGTWAGKGTNDQTIQAGSLTVSKSPATPATGNIAAADGQALVTFDFYARGEEVKVSALAIAFDYGTGDLTTTTACDEITNVAVYDEDGNIVAGPGDCASNAVSYTDTFIVPTGTHQYTVKAKIANTAETGDWVETAIDDPSTDITAKGMTSNDTIAPTPATQVEGNRMTVAAGALTATTLTEPQARNVAKGVNDFLWMTGSLSAATSGENVNVTSITIYDTIGGTGTGGFDDVDSTEIWADLTSESSARADIYETKVSKTLFPTNTGSGSQAYTLTQTLVVPKGSFIKIAFIGDLSTGATTDDTHTVDIYAVTATGADTGSTISVTPTGAGQAMTVKASGDLTVSKDGSSPAADIIIGKKTATLAVFRLAANTVEDLDLDSIYIQTTGGTYVETYYFYASVRSDGGSVDSPIQSAPGGTTAYVAVGDGTVTVPANGNVKITVTGKLNPVAYGTTLDNNGSVQVGFDGSTYVVGSTGLSSGASTPSNDGVAGNSMTAYESRPYFAVNSASPSGILTVGSQKLLAVFDVTAEDTEDITFDDGDSNQLVVQINAYVSNSDGTAGTWYLKDQVGTTLSSISVADTQLNSSGSVTFLFEDTSTGPFTVPAGETKKLYVYGDTTDFEVDGDTIQLWLDDAADANCKFGIDGDGNYSEGVIIFRGDIFAGAFSNPS